MSPGTLDERYRLKLVHKFQFVDETALDFAIQEPSICQLVDLSTQQQPTINR